MLVLLYEMLEINPHIFVKKLAIEFQVARAINFFHYIAIRDENHNYGYYD
jgi:hypothetical protein